MPLEPFNPYAPPQATDNRLGSNDGRWRWGEVVVRALAVVAGFSLVADPTSMPGVDSALGRAIGGFVFARGVGLVVLALGFLPWRTPRSAVDKSVACSFEGQAEEL